MNKNPGMKIIHSYPNKSRNVDFNKFPNGKFIVQYWKSFNLHYIHKNNEVHITKDLKGNIGFTYNKTKYYGYCRYFKTYTDLRKYIEKLQSDNSLQLRVFTNEYNKLKEIKRRIKNNV